MVTAIIAAGRNWTNDYSASQACDVVIKVFTCIKTAWNRVRNKFATVFTTIFFSSITVTSPNGPLHYKHNINNISKFRVYIFTNNN